MSRNGHTLTAAFVCAATLFTAGNSLAQTYENPFDRPITAQLRCWYKQSAGQANLATGYVDASDFALRGRWQGISTIHEGALFFTLQEPEEVNQACRRALDAAGKDTLVQASAAGGPWGKNFQIWYDGDVAAYRGRPVERIVSFGDSLSDTGNIYNEFRQTFPIHTSWFLGRFSNGPVWTEYLSRRTGLPLNTWATGGAQSDNAYGIINGVKSQVDSFIAYTRRNVNRYDIGRTLFTVWIGGNDAMNGRQARDVVADLDTALNDLVDHGARKIVLLGVPDLTRAPAFRSIDGMDGTGRHDSDEVYATVAQLNEALPRLAQRVSERTDAQVVWIDAAKHFDNVLADPGAYGFADVTRPCLDLRSQGSQVYLSTQSVRKDCTPERNVFWDMVHPTTRMHELMSRWVLADLPSAWDLR
ncbi:SGNH/GDSL hydrolase family protein [Luteibacter anthropi]|uniref:SGNH/GDSL hydrolase family protein n=1 Tax=Luteibacter anthropi TaxID=564369 RepID=UPI0020323E8C|nr:SGNH/GDSL hydrolase family protein [Luteibacter anthropi]URX63450.1 SGNH/GDSL hydrolase family protein [Luteibacter anthropi]